MSEFRKSDVSIIKALRRKGYKATPQRIAICRFALQSRNHPSAKRIFNKIRETYPTVSLATVYQTLKILKELSLVQELNLPQGQTRFDPYMKPHINLVCLRCGNIIDLDSPIAQEIVGKVATAAEFTVTEQHLDLYGVCEKCARKTENLNLDLSTA